MTKRIKLLGGEYTETSGEKYIVRRGSSVILSRAAYVELISFNPEFRPAPSDHEDFRTASQISGVWNNGTTATTNRARYSRRNETTIPRRFHLRSCW